MNACREAQKKAKYANCKGDKARSYPFEIKRKDIANQDT